MPKGVTVGTADGVSTRPDWIATATRLSGEFPARAARHDADDTGTRWVFSGHITFGLDRV